MKIRIEKDVVTFTPEHAAEAAELEALWCHRGTAVVRSGVCSEWLYLRWYCPGICGVCSGNLYRYHRSR